MSETTIFKLVILTKKFYSVETFETFETEKNDTDTLSLIRNKSAKLWHLWSSKLKI